MAFIVDCQDYTLKALCHTRREVGPESHGS